MFRLNFFFLILPEQGVVLLHLWLRGFKGTTDAELELFKN